MDDALLRDSCCRIVVQIQYFWSRTLSRGKKTNSAV